METAQTYNSICWDGSTNNFVASNDGITWTVISAEEYEALYNSGRTTTDEESRAWDLLAEGGK
jgi:hypothetical protein